MSSAILSQKKALRSSVLGTRKCIPPEARELQSRMMTSALVSCPEYHQSSSFSCFLSMNEEVDTSEIVADILRRGKQLFVPRVNKSSGVMEMIRIYGMDDLSKLSPGLWGILEPGKESNTGEGARQNALDAKLDMIIMPGVAFDSLGTRIGYGKGYYDQFITSYWATQMPKPILFGLAFKEQIVEPGIIPTEDHDKFVQGIVSPIFPGCLHRVVRSDEV